MPRHPTGNSNRLLARLSVKDRAKVLDECDEVELAAGQVLNHPGDTITHVYFPTASFISAFAVLDDESAVEVTFAGNEGLCGLSVALGIFVSPVRAVVQGAGHAWRMTSSRFVRELARTPGLRTEVDRYHYVVTSQLVQNAGCQRFHVVEQRLSRLLLVIADRAHSTGFKVTQEYLSHMLGVRRVGVSEAARKLQERGLITYARGDVQVTDRHGLERAACGCYRAEISTYQRFLG